MTPPINPYAAPRTSSDRPAAVPSLLQSQMRLTAIGLKIIYAGILIVLLTWIGVVVVPLFGFPGSATIGVLMGVTCGLGFLAVNIGPLLCVTAPVGVGLRSFAVATVVSQLMSIAGIAIAWMFGVWASVPAVCVFLVTVSLFLLFLLRVAQYIGRADLVVRSRRVGKFGAVVLFAILPIGYWMTREPVTYDLAMYVAIGMLATVVMFFVAYANLINSIGDAIGIVGVERTDRSQHESTE